MNPTVYLMRHGRTKEVEENVLRNPKDPLVPAGREDVRRGAEKLKGKGIGSIVSSDMPRAVQSAEEAGKALGVEPKTVPALRTWNRGKLQGMPQEDAEDALRYYENHPGKKVPGGESRSAWLERIEPEILKLLKQAEREPEKPPLALTHTQVMLAAPAIAKGEYPEPGRQPKMRLEPGTVMKLEKRGGRWTNEVMGDGERAS